MPKATLGSEIVFADGPQVVDEVYVTPIQRVTDGHPERFPFADVMKRVSDYWTRDHIRQVGARVIREHISQFGLD